MGCYHHFCPCREARPPLLEEEIHRGIKKREIDELRKQYIQEQGYSVIEMYECDWCKMEQSDIFAIQHLRECFPYRMPLREEKLLENIKSEGLIPYVQCDIEVPENLQEALSTFHPISRKLILVDMTVVHL